MAEKAAAAAMAEEANLATGSPFSGRHRKLLERRSWRRRRGPASPPRCEVRMRGRLRWRIGGLQFPVRVGERVSFCPRSVPLQNVEHDTLSLQECLRSEELSLSRSLEILNQNLSLSASSALNSLEQAEAMSLRPTTRAEARKKSYKVAVDAEEARWRRENVLVEIRKSKREENLNKKRCEAGPHHLSPPPTHACGMKIDNLSEMAEGAYYEDPAVPSSVITQFRRLLSDGAPIEEVVKAGIVPRVVEFILRHETPLPQIKTALPVLQRLIHLNDEEVLVDACWAISHLSHGSKDRIQAVIEAGVCPKLVELLSHPSHKVLVPALRTLGNIVTGNDVQTQEVCGVISNITAGNSNQIQAVIDANIVSPLVQLLQHAEFSVKKVAFWAISNAIHGGSNCQIQFLVSQGCIEPLCDLLAYPAPSINAICMECLDKILEVGEANKHLGITAGRNLYAQMICDCDGFNKIESLVAHDNIVIYKMAVNILKRFWVDDEEDMQDFD
nr:PREDICTED: importin subunit alpha-4-like isoform X2 [Musa acuminata subsp. malaccensis]